MKSLLWAVPKTLVYRDKISCLDEGVPLERGRQREVPPKRRYFCWYWHV